MVQPEHGPAGYPASFSSWYFVSKFFVNKIAIQRRSATSHLRGDEEYFQQLWVVVAYIAGVILFTAFCCTVSQRFSNARHQSQTIHAHHPGGRHRFSVIVCLLFALMPHVILPGLDKPDNNIPSIIITDQPMALDSKIPQGEMDKSGPITKATSSW